MMYLNFVALHLLSSKGTFYFCMYGILLFIMLSYDVIQKIIRFAPLEYEIALVEVISC